MRAASAILLTILVCFNLFGFYAMFVFKQAEIKGQMSEAIYSGKTTGERETLTFSKSAFVQLNFEDNGKELRLNGKLYDVIGTENEGNQTIITVEYDSKETALVGAFADILSQQQDKTQNSSPLKTIISHFQQDYVNANAGILCCYHIFSEPVRVAKQTCPSSTFVVGNLTPPPQFFLV